MTSTQKAMNKLEKTFSSTTQNISHKTATLPWKMKKTKANPSLGPLVCSE